MFEFYLKLEKSTKIDQINGCVMILTSKEHLKRIFKLIERFELVFNQKHKYPYIIFHVDISIIVICKTRKVDGVMTNIKNKYVKSFLFGKNIVICVIIALI